MYTVDIHISFQFWKRVTNVWEICQEETADVKQ